MSYQVDLKYIADELGFDLEDVQMLLEVFLDTSKEYVKELEISSKAIDFETIYLVSHSIKGSAANLLLDEVVIIAKNIEQNAKDKNIEFNFQKEVKKLSDTIASISKSS